MNVLMIGGTGILSTDVCKEAIRKGYNVYILNRGKRKYAINNEANLIVADIRSDSIDTIRSKISGRYYDVVIDFLSFVPDDVERIFMCIKGICKQYIFISSATAYIKENEDQIIDETVPVGNPKWSYAYNKAQCEKYIIENHLKFCDEWTVIRPYVTYSNTRIPYAIIPGHANWTLINRIILGKPIVLWDDGRHICTITHSHDFAVGAVGLFLNQKAFSNAFHITSDYTMTWKDVINEITKNVPYHADVVNMDTDYIISILPEYKGVLTGDKGTNMQFDNSKIKRTVPEFSSTISFDVGIKETINYFNSHEELQTINYAWEGRIDYLLECYYKKCGSEIKDKNLNVKVYGNISLKNRLRYIINRNPLLYRVYNNIRR